MTPGERYRWATTNLTRRKVALWDAEDAVVEAEMELHYARFIHAAASAECPTCHAPTGDYCALWRLASGEVVTDPPEKWRDANLIALFLHPARSTTPEALAAATAP